MSALQIAQFADTRPVLRPEEFLAGRLRGWGLVEPMLGNEIRRFTVEAAGTWNADRRLLVFTERWQFDDGHSDRLSWRIVPSADDEYRGYEERLKGEAEGRQAGAAFRWQYTRDVPQKDGSTVTLDFDDWFWRIDEQTVIVRATAGRFGLPFARVHVTYQKISPPPEGEDDASPGARSG